MGKRFATHSANIFSPSAKNSPCRSLNFLSFKEDANTTAGLLLDVINDAITFLFPFQSLQSNSRKFKKKSFLLEFRPEIEITRELHACATPL
jgi:hypothetical protein